MPVYSLLLLAALPGQFTDSTDFPKPALPALTVGCDGAGGAPAVAVDTVRAEKNLGPRSPYKCNFFEADRPPAVGRSGGPLVDRQGRLIGVCSGTLGGKKGYYVHIAE